MTNYKKDALKIIGVFILTLILVLTSENFFKFFTKETDAEITKSHVTSTDEKALHDELLITEPMDKTVMSYAANAKAAGLDGVVCSPLEAARVKEVCGADFLTVTPGIRFADGEKGDQVRVTTPARAKEIGSDYIVVGRPITAADDPVAAYRRCVAEFVD